MTIRIFYLLDETGSMGPIADDVIGGFNGYLDTLAADDASKDALITLVKFDSNHAPTLFAEKTPAEATRLTRDNYRPGAMTPLIDASMKIIAAAEKIEAKNDDKFIVVIHTDGAENASREFTLAQLQDKIKDRTSAGWEFLFLGASMDAWGQGAAVGVAGVRTMNFTPDQTTQNFAAMAGATVRYATTLDSNCLNIGNVDDTANAQPRAQAKVRLDHDVYQGVRARAKVEDRTMNAVINRTLRKSLVDDIDL